MISIYWLLLAIISMSQLNQLSQLRKLSRTNKNRGGKLIKKP